MYKLNNVGEMGHTCLTPMLGITSPCVSLLIHTLHKLQYTLFYPFYKCSGTPKCSRCSQSFSRGIVSKAYCNEQNMNKDIKLQIFIVQLKYVMLECGPK